MESEEYLVYTRFLRIAWNNVIAIGFGFDPVNLIFGLYVGPISVFVGSNGGTDD